jgi:hypothetical protein
MEIKTKRKPTGAAAMGAGPGRPKGMPNKVTTEFRETVRKLLDDNADNVGTWIAQVAEGHGENKADPAKALDLLTKLAEFAAPKLGRVEHVGDGGGPVLQEIVIKVVDADHG